MSSKSRTVINVVSGKGGTGKTLLTCVLADMLASSLEESVVIVDLDVYVRGLTSLLYYHRQERLRIAYPNELVVADFLGIRQPQGLFREKKLCVSKYRSFYVVPAVSSIDQILPYRDLVPDGRAEARAVLIRLLERIPDDFRFIILDSRAGYDELIAETHAISNVTICVEEQDPISRITADNLMAQLREESRVPLFRLVNKARRTQNLDETDSENLSVTDLGTIPFDIDVMNSFGSANFWDVISGSLYRHALARSWNRLSAKLRLEAEIRAPRSSPVMSEGLERRISILKTSDRILLIYGITLAIAGLGFALLGPVIIDLWRNDPMRLLSLFIGIIGAATALVPIFKVRGSQRSGSRVER